MEEDNNKYDSVVPQSIEASGNLLRNIDKKFAIILLIIAGAIFLGYTAFQHMEIHIASCSRK